MAGELPKSSPAKASPLKRVSGTANGSDEPPKKVAGTTPRKAAMATRKTPTKPPAAKAIPTKARAPVKTYARTPRTMRVDEEETEATPRSSKRVAASLAAVPSTKKPRTSAPLPSFDEDVFGTPKGGGKKEDLGGISSEAFRANERLRRQREARNFTFEGDVHAPRTTRSGRVVAPTPKSYGNGETYGQGETYGRGETEESDLKTEQDEYAGGLEVEGDEAEVDEDEHEDAGLRPLESPNRESSVPAITPLPANARGHVLRILSTLSGSVHPEFHEDEDKDALHGLAALLRSTVERGEGNSALVTGPRGVGKTRTVERALMMLPGGKDAPIIVKLSGHAQTDDRRAIREMGRQIAAAEGRIPDEEDNDDNAGGEGDVDPDAAYAPTTLPSHLLALLTKPSPRSILVIIDEFDLFTEHARQALLYCLLDVVQSVQTGPVETTPRGLCVIGITSRVDTLLLLEKRVKSRFSHRVWRVTSPLSPQARGAGWRGLLKRALIPWSALDKDKEIRSWQEDWSFAVEMLLEQETVARSLQRMADLTTDVRLLYRPFISPVAQVLGGRLDFLSVPLVAASVRSQLELAGWSMAAATSHGKGARGSSKVIKLGAVDIAAKLRGLPHPALGVIIVAKHLEYAGRTEFSLAQVEDEYARFARSRLVGSGRARWPISLLRRGFETCRALGLLAPAGPASAGPRFSKVRSALPPHEVVAFFRNDGGQALGPELAGWGKMSGGHA